MRKILIFLLFLLTPLFLAQAGELSERLKGRILLQVESVGEAWYINPDSQKRFYLGRPANAFSIMREQGLGVSNKDFDSFAGTAPERLAGKILLKVEDKGEAYYVNPSDLKMHYLGRPANAFSIMREQGLGITNSNLELIEIDVNSSPLITEEIIDDIAGEEVISDTEDLPAEEEEAATSTDSEITDSEPGETATSSEEVVIDDTEGVSTSTCVWLVEYFINKNVFGTPKATSSVSKIDFDWERGGPEEIGKTDNFSARFTANCYFAAGNYEFQTKFDDAIRIYLDRENFLQSWADNNREKIINRERNVEEGAHEIKVEYYDAIGNAKISVDWIRIE